MKKLLYVVIGIAVLYLILAMIGKSRIVVERKISITKPVGLVKNQMGDLKFFHEKWSPWTDKDPAMTINFAGDPNEVGHSMNWASKVKEVGQGTMAITAMTADSIIMALGFEGHGESKAYYVVKDTSGASAVTWGMEMNVPFFGRPIMMFMNMDKMIGPDFEKDLNKLKTAIESIQQEVEANYEIKELEWPETNYAGSKKETVEFAKIGEFFGKNFQAIGAEMGKDKIKMESAPSGIYFGYDMAKGTAELAAAVKVAKGVKLKGIESYVFPAGKVVSLTYFGDYMKVHSAYEALEAYMKEKGLTKSVSIEEYANDPMSEKDTAKWQTNIYYLLK